MSEIYSAVVVGSGPAGIAVVGNLLEKHASCRILWVDAHFRGGRISSNYREVSSNTKVTLILQYARALEPFRQVIDTSRVPNAINQLEKLDQNAGCALDHAADMFVMVADGLLKLDQVEGVTGTVIGADYNKELSLWCTQVQPAKSQGGDGQSNDGGSFEVYSSSLILCTGSSPSAFTIDLPDFRYHKLDLDIALSPSCLGSTLPQDAATTVGVIGSSHSAVTVLMNLYRLASTSHPHLQVKWFSRRPLIYAVYMDGWILHDNTGLKGVSATFARENLEDDRLSCSPVGKFIEKVDCSDDREDDMYQTNLPKCTHIVQAVGFIRDPLPPLTRDGAALEEVTYDHQKGGFADTQGRKITGLYGAGIAFPELVTDPAGNTEFAVGFWKFMKYLKNVVPHWTIG